MGFHFLKLLNFYVMAISYDQLAIIILSTKVLASNWKRPYFFFSNLVYVTVKP